MTLFFFLLGMGSTISQSVIFREFLVIFYGNELSLGIILFFWLLAVTLGAFFYPVISRWIKDSTRWYCNLVFLFSLMLPGLIPFIRISRGLSGTPYGQFVPFASMAWISMAAIFPPAFLIGLLFPLGCRILKEETAVARVYVMESLGSLAGGAMFSFILIRFLSAPLIASILLSLFCLALILNIITQKETHPWKKPLISIFLAGLAAAALILSPGIDKQTIQARWKTLIQDMPLLAQADSRYQNLALTRQMDQYSIFFNGTYSFSFPNQYDDAVLAHHILTQHPDPAEILVIGEVTPGFISEMLKEPVKSVTVVYMDPAVYSLMEPVLPPDEREVMNDPRVSMITGDGRLFVKRTGKKFDLIFLNLPDPSTAFINRYYTVDFFRETERILKPGGVLGLNMTSSENFLGSRILDYNTAIYRSLKKIFPHISISPGTWTYLFASVEPGITSDDFKTLFDRFQKRPVKETTFTPYTLEMLYEKDRVKFKREKFEENPGGRLNTDLFPVAYLYNLKLWDRYSKSNLAGVFKFMEEKGPGFWISIPLIPLLIFLAFILIFRPSREKSGKLCTFYGIFTTGLCAMGLSVILIYSYQTLYGYLFERIGFLIAMFMLGLSLGGFSAGRLIKRNMAGVGILAGAQASVAILCLALPILLKNLGNMPFLSNYLFFFLVTLTGVLTGHVLPLGASLLEKWGLQLGKSAAIADGADHLGGCLGAALVGTFFVPLLGIPDSLMALASLQISAVIMWGIGRVGKLKN